MSWTLKSQGDLPRHSLRGPTLVHLLQHGQRRCHSFCQTLALLYPLGALNHAWAVEGAADGRAFRPPSLTWRCYLRTAMTESSMSFV